MAKAKSNEEIKEEVKEEKKMNFDLNEIKGELDDYIDIQIQKKVVEELDKTNRKIWREKNRKLFFKNMIIILLVLAVIYLLYLLNKVGYFGKYFDTNSDNTVKIIYKEKDSDGTENTTTTKEPTLDELIEKYGKLIDKVTINEKSTYLEDFYKGSISSKLRNYITLNQMDLSTLKTEEDYNVIEEDTFKTAFEKLFKTTYENESFDYNGTSVKYFGVAKSYLTEKVLESSKSNIKREITNIKVDGTKVTITTVEGLVKEDKLYNILTSEEVEGYSGDKLSKYKDKLNTVNYVFDDEKFTDLTV